MYPVFERRRSGNLGDLQALPMARTKLINVAFAGGNGFPPEDSGGVQSSTDDLARRLMANGHRPSILAPLYGRGLFGITARTRLKFSHTAVVRDILHGYPVYRSWFPDRAVSDFVKETSPDAAVVQCHGTVPISQEFQSRGVPLIVYLRNVEFKELGGDLRCLRGAEFISNSEFTARTYKSEFGIESTVIPPTIDRSLFQTETSGQCVTFINPVAEKGVERAIEIAARCPDIPFLFVESWLLQPDDLRALKAAIRPFPNIRFEHRADDVRSVYGRTRILLAPSVWAEAWGRVASEAHCSGIPVIGSTQGGLPEAIGPGGFTLDPKAPPEQWVQTLRRLWDNPEQYRLYSDAARIFAGRPELDPDKQYDVFFAIIQRAIIRSRSRA